MTEKNKNEFEDQNSDGSTEEGESTADNIEASDLEEETEEEASDSMTETEEEDWEEPEPEEETPVTFGSAVKSVYDFLTSMKSALTFLILVGILSFIGAIIPQEKIDPGQVQALRAAKPTLAQIYQSLGFFDIYHTFYFLTLLALIVISIVLCQLPRIKKTWNRTMVPRFFPNDDFYKKFKNTATFESKDSFSEVKDEVQRILRSRLYRARAQESADMLLLDAGKMRWGAFGGLAFHISFIVVGFGVIYGLVFGFNGYLEIIEKETGYVKEANFTQVRAQGALFKGHREFGLYLSEFNVQTRPDGSPRGFISHVTVTEKDKKPIKTEVRMNKVLDKNGYRLFQQSYGYAPVVKLSKKGEEPLIDRPLKFFFGNDQSYGYGGLNFPSLNNLSYTMFVVPTNKASNPGAPFIDVCVQEGEAQTQDQADTNCNQLPALKIVPEDQRATTPHKTFEGRVYEGDKVSIGDFKFEFKEMRDYTGLNVVYNPGIPIIYFGFILGSIAILISLYIHERRIWVRIRPNGKVTEITFGGLSSRNMVQFTQEFNAIASEIEQVARGKRA